ncbi:MAG: polysaccharide lyase [Cyanobacteria bacterium J06632_22]
MPTPYLGQRIAALCVGLLTSCHFLGTYSSTFDRHPAVGVILEKGVQPLLVRARQLSPSSVSHVFPITPDWQQVWLLRDRGSWGLDNLEVRSDSSGQILRVYYPSGSASPIVTSRDGAPLGGAQFYAPLPGAAQTAMRLRYRLRFSDNFDFVRGGKLPGLYGGGGNSGGNIPDGTDGFSTRLMWRSQGAGEVYAYLPSSERYGTSIGQGAWQFQTGRWYILEQELRLNQPGQANGQLRLWVNGRLVVEETDLVFRTVDTLEVNGLFFSTFFGGGDASWATPRDVYIDFSDFSLTALS